MQDVRLNDSRASRLHEAEDDDLLLRISITHPHIEAKKMITITIYRRRENCFRD